jgi:hypothetical protein
MKSCRHFHVNVGDFATAVQLLMLTKDPTRGGWRLSQLSYQQHSAMPIGLEHFFPLTPSSRLFCALLHLWSLDYASRQISLNENIHACY